MIRRPGEPRILQTCSRFSSQSLAMVPQPRFHRSFIGAIGALMNRVLQPRPLIVLGLKVWMGTAAGADELVESLQTHASSLGPLIRSSRLRSRFCLSPKQNTSRHFELLKASSSRWELDILRCKRQEALDVTINRIEAHVARKVRHHPHLRRLVPITLRRTVPTSIDVVYTFADVTAGALQHGPRAGSGSRTVVRTRRSHSREDGFLCQLPRFAGALRHGLRAASCFGQWMVAVSPRQPNQ